MKLSVAFASAFLLLAPNAFACKAPVVVCPLEEKGSFPLIAKGEPAALLVEPSQNSAVQLAANNFATDLERVSGRAPLRLTGAADLPANVVIAGVVGESAVIDGLAKSGKIDLAGLSGQWEAFRQIVVDDPFPTVKRALVIAGADRRGVVFGLYDLSEKIGVSPWHWFADVPVARQQNLFVTAGARHDQPGVRYRGFFINDEAPAFSTWSTKKFGGANSKMYAHVFELLLRLKGNYLWPAMWPPRAFNDDDPQNKVLADAMGVVMGTSHHEPLTLAHDEWRRSKEKGVTDGRWDYSKNAENLRKFWRGGVERMMSKGDGKGYEAVLTIGMRGDGDEPMSDSTAIQLLEQIVADQRAIIADVTGRPASETPQIWALYKEVQDYYDKGMKVPDDVTLLFADDNWGQVRRLPTGDLDRKGGYGVYYHFDYVGGPRNYKWLNTNQIEKTWQQMDLAYRRGAKALWIVNVGDIKPMEFPLSFFMDHAWNPEAMTLEAVTNYPEEFARRTFGVKQAKLIGELLTRYAQLGALRKPELLDADTFPLGGFTKDELDGGEFGIILGRWGALERDLVLAKKRLPASQREAFFQIVEHPIVALSNLYQLYYAVAWNRKLAAAGDPRANVFAARAESAFQRDKEIAAQYHALNGGKWDGMMLQTHIGYTSWQQPDEDVMPEVKRVPAGDKTPRIEFAVPTAAQEGVVIEAADFAREHGGGKFQWRVIPNLGRGPGAVTAFPQGLPSTSEKDGVYLEYPVEIPRSGEATVQLHVLPTLNTSGGIDVRLGVSIDEGAVQTVASRLVPSPDPPKIPEQADWEKAVIENNFVLEAKFPGLTAGQHVIKVWRIDDNALLRRLVVR